jgi:DNA-binding Lrp family transcriptional regulator
MKPRKLDEIDLRILAALQEQGRITNQRLSELVGLSPRPCLERVRRLEAAGYIAGYTAVLDPTRFAGLVLVFAHVALKAQTPAAETAFERRARRAPEVVECHQVSGDFDYLVKLACRSLEHYRELTAAWLDDASLGVARVTGHAVLRPVRHFGGYPLDGPRSRRDGAAKPRDPRRQRP